MSLSGSFRETSFADLLQFYSVSKQTVAVSVRLGGGAVGGVDGVFFFADGDLVGATLGDAAGRDAVRHALRLRDGHFTVEVGVRPADPSRGETLRSVVMEEVVRLDEENRRAAPAAPKHTGALAAGAAWFAAPEAVPPAEVAVTPPPRPVPPRLSASSSAAAGASRRVARATAATVPAERTPPPSPAAPRRTPPAPPAPARPLRHGTGLLVAIALVAAALLGGVTWYVLARVPSASAPASAGAPAAGPRGVLDDALVLGMVASFTGSNQERGRAMRLGWEAALADVNAAGGVHGRRLRLVVVDDGYDPARTGPAMKDVVEGQGAFAVVGNVGTATAAVAIPYCAEQDCVFFGALSGADLLRKSPPDRHVFNFRAGLAAEAAAAVRYLVDVRRLRAPRIAVLAQDDDFGASGRRGALRQLAAYGVADADVLKLRYPRNTADVREAVARLKERAADVDAVVMVATYKPAATFVRKTRDAGLRLSYTTVSADSNGLAEELVVSGEGYTEDVLLTQVVPVPTSPATTLVRYRKALEQHAPGEKPGSTSLEAWIGAQIFVEGLRRAGRELDTGKLVAALEGIQDWDLGVGGAITFGPADHQGSDRVWGWRLQPDGTYAQVELE